MFKQNSLLAQYHALKESGSTSDWPLLLANVLHKLLLEKFKGVSSPWKQYTTQSDLSDFKTAKRVLMDEAPDVVKVLEDGVYKDSLIKDNGYDITLETVGRTFSVGRRAIINDDLQALRKQPERFGRAAARTLAKEIVGRIEKDGLTYDGKHLFDMTHAGGANFTANVSLLNNAASIAAVSAGMTAITKAKDETGEKLGITPKFLLVGPENEDAALRIVQGQSFLPVTTDGGTTAVGKAQRLSVLMEPFFTSTTCAYIMADPSECPVIEVGFLNGKQTPDLLVKKSDAVMLAGGDDQWGYDFDDISFKIRWDYVSQLAMYQGIYRISS